MVYAGQYADAFLKERAGAEVQPRVGGAGNPRQGEEGWGRGAGNPKEGTGGLAHLNVILQFIVDKRSRAEVRGGTGGSGVLVARRWAGRVRAGLRARGKLRARAES